MHSDEQAAVEIATERAGLPRGTRMSFGVAGAARPMKTRARWALLNKEMKLTRPFGEPEG